ncbi:MAG: phage minor head protein, partial [Elusimicrobiota bacterium]
VPDDAKLEQAILYLLNNKQKQLIDMIEREHGESKLSEVKDLHSLTRKLKEILSFNGLKGLTEKVIKHNFLKGWEEQEKKINRNFIPNKEAIQFIQNYTFDNIKDMGDEIANDLRAELERGIMNGEGIDKIKDRVQGVMKSSKSRAETIARTEVNRAQNTGSLQLMKNVDDEYDKKWLAKIDDRTSEICKELDGQQVGINETFKAKGWEGQNPPSHPNCFDKNTEVYTENGWKLFKDLNNEKIWSLNPKTLEPEWVNYKDFIKRKADKIVCYKSHTLDTAVTPDHNQFVKFRKKQKGRKDAGEWKLVQEKDLPDEGFNFYTGKEEIKREELAREEKDYNDFVYDVELEKNHILLTRRNGKVLWSGNCRSTLLYIPKEAKNEGATP